MSIEQTKPPLRVSDDREEVEGPEEGVDLLAVAVALLSEWRVGLIAWAVVSLVCIVLVFRLKPQFVASAVMLPQSGRAESGALASLFGTRGPGTLYVGLLQSRSVQDAVIETAGLQQLFQNASQEQARQALSGKSTFAEAATGLLTISVRDTNAADAARIANAYLDALEKLNESMGLQQSSQTTHFFEQQLEQERTQLAAAESELARIQKQTGLIASEAQTQIGLGAIAGVRGDITARQVQLAALLQGATEQNPQVQTLRSQISQLQAQERRLEEGSGAGSPAGAALPAGRMPQSNLDILRAQREVRYHESLVTSLASQFEAARLNETFSRSAFQIVDRAVAPEHKVWPPRLPYLLASLVFGALAGVVAILVRLTWRRVASDDGHRAQLTRLRGAFRKD